MLPSGPRGQAAQQSSQALPHPAIRTIWLVEIKVWL
jgi:hypothetical protein